MHFQWQCTCTCSDVASCSCASAHGHARCGRVCVVSTSIVTKTCLMCCSNEQCPYPVMSRRRARGVSDAAVGVAVNESPSARRRDLVRPWSVVTWTLPLVGVGASHAKHKRLSAADAAMIHELDSGQARRRREGKRIPNPTHRRGRELANDTLQNPGAVLIAANMLAPRRVGDDYVGRVLSVRKRRQSVVLRDLRRHAQEVEVFARAAYEIVAQVRAAACQAKRGPSREHRPGPAAGVEQPQRPASHHLPAGCAVDVRSDAHCG
mmetsp:Transcript_45526/g.148001  ORF Transcript_45526/g.148001 Transcript_45526/m.148001 type:complete len:264 (-) Transcript_45526:916-1707(-)